MTLQLLHNLFMAGPLLLAWLGAGIFALLRWRRHPEVSFLICLSAVLYLSIFVGLRVAPVLLESVLPSGVRAHRLFRDLYGLAANSVYALGNATSAMLLLMAAFGWRRPPAPAQQAAPYPVCASTQGDEQKGRPTA